MWPDNGSGQRRRDELTYYGPGTQFGYLKDEIVDANNFELTTTYEYDLVGNVTRIVDPKGNDTLFEVNELNQVVEETSREVSSGGARYQRDIYYDANNNIVRVDVQNLNDQGQVPSSGNTHFTTLTEYEILNNPVRTCQEVTDYTGTIPGTTNLPVCTGLPTGQFATTEYQYDDNRNRTLVKFGEAVEGRQAANTLKTLYDERDLVFKEIRAESDSTNHSTTQLDYDGNRNIKTSSQGTENSPRTTTHTYDGYNRVLTTTDPMANVTTYQYDANGNQTLKKINGELTDVTGGSGNVRLYEATSVFDDMDRKTQDQVKHFKSDQSQIGDGVALTQTEYTDNSQVEQVTDDNGHETNLAYDTANRVATVTDAKSNTVTYGYDLNSNVISETEVDRSDLGGSFDQTIVTEYAFDGLDRIIRVEDALGNVVDYKYDSRSNQTTVLDALRSSQSSPGNEVRYAYDGLNRLVLTTRILTSDGTGATSATDTIVTGQAWDDSSRLISQTDDNGNVTTYGYDALDRLETTTFADQSTTSSTFDTHDNQLTMTDGNGTVVTWGYDLLNRRTTTSVSLASGIVGTTCETFAYDGLSRIVRAEDNDSVVTQGIDSLSSPTSETIGWNTTATCTDSAGTAVTIRVFDGVGNLTSLTYPGGRAVTQTFDVLDRPGTISDGSGTVATYQYLGPGRVTRRDFGNGTRLNYQYDGAKRVVGTTHTKISNGAILDDRSYIWDGMSNKTRRRDLRSGGPQLIHDYAYDSAYRLKQTTKTPGGVTSYGLDGVGNRTTVTGGPDPGTYTMTSTTPPTEPADAQMNQYTTTPFDSRTYDRNGNLQGSSYDYRNQVVTAASGSVQLAYDALGRRIQKTVGSSVTRYLFDGWREIEERDGPGAILATYVYGSYIDEVLQMQRGSASSYFHADDLYSVMAASDGTGAAVERYEYEDFGKPLFFDGAGNSIGGTAIGNPWLFTGDVPLSVES